MASITFEPLISPALWIALALLAIGMTAWHVHPRPMAVTRWRWFTIIALWSVGLAAVLVVLLNPMWLEPIPPPPGKPLLTILVDQSGSMAVEDAPKARSRFAEATAIATEAAERLSDRFDLQVRTFAAGSLPTSIDQLPLTRPEGMSTNLVGALGSVLTNHRVEGQAVLLISDGIHNGPGGMSTVRQTLQTSRAMDVPIYTVALGGATTLRDLETSLVRPQELSFVGQNVPVPVVIRQRGKLTDSARVTLLKEGRTVARETVQVAANGQTPVRFHVSEPTSGLYRYEVRVDPLAGEATERNNTATFLLRVVDNPVRVLLLEGKPYWDAKFLIRTLGADPSVELDAIVRISDTRFLKRTLRLPRSEVAAAPVAAVPTEQTPAVTEPARRIEAAEILRDLSSITDDEAGLAPYQLLVLGRDSEAFLTDRMVDRLREWISHDGGALVCYRGAPVAIANQNLARLLPVRWTPSRETRFRMQLTERGSELDWLSTAAGGDADIFGKLPSLASSAVPDRPKPQSVVLVRTQEDQGPAVVTYQPYGTGRVVAVEGSGMWRWAFLAPQFQEHDQAYSALWQSLLRWLVTGVGLIPGQDLVLRSDKVAYNINESVSTMLLMRPEAERVGVPTVELLSVEGALVGEFTPVPLGDEPGVYRVDFGVLPEGNYRATALRHGDGDGSARPPGTGATVAFDVRSFSGEQLDVQARPDVMARIAEETAGAVLTRDTVGTLADEFRQHSARSRPEHVRRLTAWDRW
jgi:hypothetical protein